MIELRTYRTAPGRGEEATASLRGIAAGLFVRYGFRPLGFWITEDDDERALVYMLEWDDDAEREAGWAKLYADPQWIERRAAVADRGPAIVGISSRILVPLDGFPAQEG